MKYKIIEGTLSEEWIENIISSWREELRATGKSIGVISEGTDAGVWFVSPHPDADRRRAELICKALNESEAAD